MANEYNLVDLRIRPTEEIKEIARLGGIASGKARRHKALIKASCERATRTEDLLTRFSDNKRHKVKLNLRNIYGNNQKFLDAYNEDLAQATKNAKIWLANEKKEQRRLINHRYYIKHRGGVKNGQ
jgi:hypothetical protein